MSMYGSKDEFVKSGSIYYAVISARFIYKILL